MLNDSLSLDDYRLTPSLLQRHARQQFVGMMTKIENYLTAAAPVHSLPAGLDHLPAPVLAPVPVLVPVLNLNLDQTTLGQWWVI